MKALGAGRVQVIGWKDVDYPIEASEDLKTWRRLGTTKGGVEFTDADAANAPHRYYRALVLP